MPKTYAYVGTYANADSRSIYVYAFDEATGALREAGGVSGESSPSFQVIGRTRLCLYTVNEVDKSGAVSAYSIDPQTGALTFINRQSSGGPGPCHLTTDRTDRYLLVANYSGGSVAMLPIRDDGGLEPASDFHQHEGSSVNPGRQKEPHAHSINVDPQNRFAFAADLGIDKIVIYRLDLENGKLIPTGKDASVAPGAGSRHFTFDPAGRFAYVINELDNTVTAFAYDADQGTLDEIQVISTLPDDFTGTSYCAEVVMAPSGKFLYGSNRGHESIAIFAVDSETGKLSTVGYESVQGKNPRNFILDSTGTYLLAANQDTGNVVSFRVNPESGELTATGHVTQVAKPVCIKLLRLPA